MSNVLSNLAAFIVALGVIIFVHEAGHLLMAKAFGMRVLTFSLGFGKRIWGFTRGETEYKVSLIPLGGYVRLGGEDPSEVSDDPHDFMNTPRWQRILVYLAGPAMNVLLAILLIAGVLMVGIQVPTLPEIPAVVGSVAEDSPASAAGLLPGDEVLTVNGKQAEQWEDVHFAFITSPEREVSLTVLRQGEQKDVALVPVWGWGLTLGSGHMNPDRAATALQLLQPRVAIPIHWGTYFPLGFGRLSHRFLRRPPRLFKRRAERQAPQVNILHMEPGETVDLSTIMTGESIDQ